MTARGVAERGRSVPFFSSAACAAGRRALKAAPEGPRAEVSAGDNLGEGEMHPSLIVVAFQWVKPNHFFQSANLSRAIANCLALS